MLVIIIPDKISQTALSELATIISINIVERIALKFIDPANEGDIHNLKHGVIILADI